jgi:ERF superfamily
MNTGLATQKSAEIEVSNPMGGILQLAIEKGATIDQLERLIAMHERFEANEARKAFSTAFSAFKAESVSIIKNTEVKAGPLAGSCYANLFDVVNAVIPALSKHGLSHSWKLTKDEKGWMEVTCIIRHVLGHSESVSMGAEPDTGPGRNAIQARGSAKSYLERYTLLAATGMAASDGDNDGNAPPTGKGMELEEFERLSGLIETAGSLESLKQIYLAACKDAKDLGDQKAINKFAVIKNARYKELA